MAENLKVVVVGCGFGGLAVTRALAKSPVDLTVIDQHNYHMFQPLLYQVATAGLSPAEIAQPIRGLVGQQENTHVLLGRVVGIDKVARLVRLEDRTVPYDRLVLATGSIQSWFGHDDWRPVAPGLKRIEDALDIRCRVLLAFEHAEALDDDPAERRRLLNFVVIGGGATGVELAGAIAMLAKTAIARDFRRIDPTEARIVLLEGGDRVLPNFPPPLSAYARRALTELGVEVRTGAMVTACDADGVTLGGERIEARTLIWSAGVKATPAADWLGIEPDKAGRIEVTPDLTVPGHPEIYAIGDVARCLRPGGTILPGVAPVAKQQGAYVGSAIHALATGQPPVKSFSYKDYGDMATIGRNHGVVKMGRLRLTGVPAWIMWGFAHIFFLIGFRNRTAVMLSWFWAWATYERGVRLITD